MNKQERGKLIKLFEEALTINRDSEYSDFNHGYEWGVHQAMIAVGFTQTQLFDIWDRVTYPADPPAWACGQDPERCEDCGSLIGEDLRCPRCDAANELEERLQAIVSEARKTGGEL